MMRWSWASKTIVVWASLLAVCTAGMGAGGTGETANEPIAVIPAESLFCVQVNDLTMTLGKFDEFLAGVAPVKVSQLVPAQLAQFLGSTEANGVNMSGSFAVFGPLPGGAQPGASPIGILAPVTSYKQFVEGNPKVTPPDAAGISTIGEGKKTFIAVQVDGYALVTTPGNRQALTEAKKLLTGTETTPLSKRLGAQELKRADESAVWVYANVQAAAKIVEPMIEKMLEEAKEKMKTAPGQGPFMMPSQQEASLTMFAKSFSALLKQTELASVSINPSAAAIRFNNIVAAMPGSEMAKIFSTDGAEQQQQSRLLPYLENGAIMNMVTTLSPEFTKAITIRYLDLLPGIAGETISKEDMDEFRQLATNSVDALAGPVAFSFLPDPNSKPPFRIRYVAVLKDKQKFYEVLDQTTKMMNEGVIADIYKKLGIRMQFDVKRNVTTYEGVPIDAIHLTMQPVDVNSPEAQQMKRMFGEGFDIRLATVDDLLVYALSATPEQGIQSLIDQAKSSSPGQVPSEVQAAMQLLPDAKDAEVFMTYNYLRALQMATAMMPVPIPQAEVSTQSSVAISADVGDAKFQTSVVVPKQQVLEVMMVFMKMQQEKIKQQMQEQQKQQGQPEQPQGQPQSQAQGQT